MESESTTEEKNLEEIYKLFEKSIICYIVKLQSSGKMPLSTCTEVFNMTKSVIENVVQICEASLKADLLNKESILQKFEDTFKYVKSQYCLEKYLITEGFYNKPEEIALGSRHKLVSKKGANSTKLVYDTLQYVSIEKTLKMVVEIPGVLDSIFEITKQANTVQPTHSDPMTSTYFQAQRMNSYNVSIPTVYLDYTKCVPSRHRRHLVKIMCQNLVEKTHSSRPSTDQRNQLAECIVSQLYPTFTGQKWKELKEVDPITDDLVAEVQNNPEAMDMKNWLLHHASPPQKVFDFMLKTFALRRAELLKCKKDLDYESFFLQWPRMLDAPGAIEHDFGQMHPLIADNLSSKWNSTALKIAQYFASMKKSLQPFGIVNYSGGNDLTAAFFMLPILLRSKVKKMTQSDSLKSFLRVIQPFEDVDTVVAALPKTTTLIMCKGDLESLELQNFFVAFNCKAIQRDTLLSAVDLAFKTFYVFNYQFPACCGSVWQFLDYQIYDMLQKNPLTPGISELAAFLGQD
ncbi:unnamed protein product [Allacma fusca]|uniref:Uncharacterized protein n=1 Tax=Allacma fusca TaxID=39272 RepID=A0A8J2NYF7_9HEXA|nr:unnamed protein product [Allacma fusca]